MAASLRTRKLVRERFKEKLFDEIVGLDASNRFLESRAFIEHAGQAPLRSAHRVSRQSNRMDPLGLLIEI
jgi:hypothetical protein